MDKKGSGEVVYCTVSFYYIYRGFFVWWGMCRFVNDKANTNSIVYWVELQK